jgi:hypothetical protein
MIDFFVGAEHLLVLLHLPDGDAEGKAESGDYGHTSGT